MNISVAYTVKVHVHILQYTALAQEVSLSLLPVQHLDIVLLYLCVHL